VPDTTGEATPAAVTEENNTTTTVPDTTGEVTPAAVNPPTTVTTSKIPDDSDDVVLDGERIDIHDLIDKHVKFQYDNPQTGVEGPRKGKVVGCTKTGVCHDWLVLIEAFPGANIREYVVNRMVPHKHRTFYTDTGAKPAPTEVSQPPTETTSAPTHNFWTWCIENIDDEEVSQQPTTVPNATGGEAAPDVCIQVTFEGEHILTFGTAPGTTGDELKDKVKDHAQKAGVLLPAGFTINYRAREGEARCHEKKTVKHFLDTQNSQPSNADLSIRVAKPKAKRPNVGEYLAGRRKAIKENEGKKYTSSAYPSLNASLDNDATIIDQLNDMSEEQHRQGKFSRREALNNQDCHLETQQQIAGLPETILTGGVTVDTSNLTTQAEVDAAKAKSKAKKALGASCVAQSNAELAEIDARERELNGGPPKKPRKTPQPKFKPTNQQAINKFFGANSSSHQ